MRNRDTSKARARWKELREERIKKYNLNPKKCKVCGLPIPYDKAIRKSVFCSHSCSAKYNNERRIRTIKKNTRHCIICGKITPSKNNVFCEPWGLCQAKYNINKSKSAGTTPSRETIRRYLLLSRDAHCEVCGLSRWNNTNIPLEAHHIDGNFKNNDDENLQLICPNCHSLTENYRGKNKGNGRGEYRGKRKWTVTDL